MEVESVNRSASVLIVDDNSNLAQSARKLLELASATADVAGSSRGARRRLGSRTYDLVLTDVVLPDGSGLDLVRDFGGRKGTRFVLTTGRPGLMKTIREACPPGTALLPKPFSAGELMRVFEQQIPGEMRSGGERSGEGDAFSSWIGSSDPVSRVKRQIAAVAPLNTTVFLLGESGTGKELAAESLHRASGREGPFLTINCGAIPETLIANELFGHEKGSFTGANRAQAGLFERADGGTVFLDEVTELPMEQQPHLLRVLETKSVTRIGGGRPIPVDVRVVAASNRVEDSLVKNQILREDLYYRLMVFPILLPALRARRGDIAEFVQQFLDDWNREHGTRLTCSDEDMERLERHRWPGNVRELKHTVERMAIMGMSGGAEPPVFLDGISGAESGPGVPVGTSIRELERRLILATLDHFDGDRRRTAGTLGISPKTLYNRLKDYEHAASAERADAPDR